MTMQVRDSEPQPWWAAALVGASVSLVIGVVAGLAVIEYITFWITGEVMLVRPDTFDVGLRFAFIGSFVAFPVAFLFIGLMRFLERNESQSLVAWLACGLLASAAGALVAWLWLPFSEVVVPIILACGLIGALVARCVRHGALY